MVALIELVIFILFLPCILFGVVLAMIYDAICSTFEPKLLMAAIWMEVVGLWLLGHMPENDPPWQSMIQVVAQSHVLGVPTSFIPMGLAFCLFVAALVARKRNPDY
uniref:hypothetical protein n=1 Tax=Pseudomonas syringae TaxID=317 RepID=UPI001E29E5D2|nr:hypothetical protein [Pseudomonas syringae]QOQ33460.1 hypothetical protein [Pseudomonas syringae pv. actinidiae]